jgi:hypothetical protein
MEDLPQTASYYINVMPSTKTQVKTFIEKYVGEILEGHENPIKVAVQLKAMEEVIKGLRSHQDLRELILSEAEKYGKNFEECGAKLQIKEAGTKYDYTVCGDSKLNAMYAEMEDLKKRIKDRETFLKSIKDESVADAETGEILLPPLKKSTTIVSVTLKK